MSPTRRDFIKATTSTAAALAVGKCLAVDVGADARIAPAAGQTLPPPAADTAVIDLANEALNAARGAGASYADVRIGRYRRQSVATRERQVLSVSDNESYGLGVRTLVNGSWGFAATGVMTRAGARAAAVEAVVLSRAARAVQARRVELAPVKPVSGTWITPITRDPLEVPLEDKIALLLATNEAALKVANVRFVNSSLALLREVKTLVTSEGTNVTQTMIRVGPDFSATAIGNGDFQSYEEELAPRGAGWEYIESLNMPVNAERWASLAAEKLTAKSVQAGQYDLILEPTNLWLTIHESIGHPTELDRAIGEEANYAGTSFVAPPEKVIGQLQYGPPIMNIQADRTQEGSLSRVAWDDEGVPADQWPIVEKGVFKDYQTTREQVARIQKLTGVSRSHGCSFAESWNAVQFQRMPNISLLPGDKDLSVNDIVAATERGILIRNTGSWSIDHQRYNFQFSGQGFYEVRNGKIAGMLRDVAYQANTPVFWRSMDMIGGKSSYWMGGAFNDGKGEPSQSNSVSHGCVPARFRNVTILNTARSS
ncbi:MAG TPA: TldD/PmbA family protein [Vicinamibacterales bacterium]|nr:TldD/PmbA family protein [Vicinamibacterales bacterium]